MSTLPACHPPIMTSDDFAPSVRGERERAKPMLSTATLFYPRAISPDSIIDVEEMERVCERDTPAIHRRDHPLQLQRPHQPHMSHQPRMSHQPHMTHQPHMSHHPLQPHMSHQPHQPDRRDHPHQPHMSHRPHYQANTEAACEISEYDLLRQELCDSLYSRPQYMGLVIRCLSIPYEWQGCINSVPSLFKVMDTLVTATGMPLSNINNLRLLVRTFPYQPPIWGGPQGVFT